MSKPINSFFLFFIFLFLSLALLLLDYFRLMVGLRAGTEKIFNPAKAILKEAKETMVPFGPGSGGDPILQAKIDYLTLENAKIVNQLNQLQEENEDLKKQLKVAVPVPGKFAAAKVLALLEQTLTLDKGENEGIKEGMLVISEGVLVGRVSSVSPFACRVKLPSAEGNQIKVKVLPLNEKGTLKGTAEGRLILDEILQKVKLESDQVLVTTAEDGQYPPDLPVARVEKVVSQDVEVFKKAEVKPLLDYQSLKLVMIRM